MGSFAAKMKARAQMHLMKEEQEQTSAVVRLQRWWIQMNGGFAAKMKANAKIQLKKEEEEMNNAARKIQGKNKKLSIYTMLMKMTVYFDLHLFLLNFFVTSII